MSGRVVQGRSRAAPCVVAVAFMASMAGCTGAAPGEQGAQAGAGVATMPAPVQAPDTGAVNAAEAFMQRLSTHCGQAFAGRIVTDVPAQPEDAFVGKSLVMHVRKCDPGRVEIPFHVGEDRSRTWVFTRTAEGLRLKHDHRHADGSEDAVTQYGGDTMEPGTALRQAFPVDAESIAMFEREGLLASVTNTWAVEIEPDTRFLYELARPGGRLFRVEFDLGVPVAVPPAPWGHD